LETRKKARFILQTDIAKFYPSIYSHSIPWALHTKPISKKSRSSTLLGNQLDELLRKCQDLQTTGIPIGPDTSLVFAEILLSAVDEALMANIGGMCGFRYVDDYEFGANSHSDAEQILSGLQNELREYELEVNFSKTKIVELPVWIDATWTPQLRECRFRSGTERFDLLNYFNQAFELATSFPQESVLKYAVQRLRSYQVSPENWSLLEAFLFQCITVESGTFKPVIEQLITYHLREYTIDTAALREILNLQICGKCPKGQTHEIAWAIWALIYWGLPIEAASVKALERIEASTVALLTLHAQELGLLRDSLVPHPINERVK